MANYLIYPCKTMRITQNYNGTTSHKPYSTGTPNDFPLDEGCDDSGRGYMYCPCDEVVVKRIYGVGNGGTNTFWLESTSKVDFADGTSDYFTMVVIHPNDDDLKKIKEGQKFKRFDKICREGRDGTSGYHFHFSAGKGKMKGSGWVKNSNGKWVLTTTNGTSKPERLFFVDTSFTKVVNSKGLIFKNLPTNKYTTGNYVVTANLLYVRKGAGTIFAKVKFDKLTDNAKKKIRELVGYDAEGYVKGVTFTVSKVKNNWGKTPSGWVCLDYCAKI